MIILVQAWEVCPVEQGARSDVRQFAVAGDRDQIEG
jgi:hypothetical protein